MLELILDAFHTSKRWIERTLRASPTGYALLDLDGRILSCNPAFLGVLDLPERDVTNAGLTEVLDEEHRDVVSRWLAKTRTGNAQDATTMALRFATGISVSANFDTLCDEENRTVALTLMIESTSEAQWRAVMAEVERASLATARFERMIANVPGGIYEFMIDGAGNVSFPYATHQVGPLLGTTSEKLRADATVGFANIHPDDQPAFQAAIEHSMQSLELFKMVIRILHSEENTRWLRITSCPIVRPEGGVIWYGYLFDVTEEVETQQAAEIAAETAMTATARLERLAENVPGGIFEFVMDEKGEMSFPYVTSDMGALLGTTTDVIRKDAAAGFAHIHPDDMEGLMEAIEVSKETLGLFKHRYRVNHPEKGVRWIAVNSTPLATPEGGVIWYGSLFDVTDDVEREHAFKSTAEVARKTSLRLQQLTGNVPGGIFEFLLDAKGEMSFPYLSQGFGSLVGRPLDGLRADADAFFDLVHADDVAALRAQLGDSARSLGILKTSYRIHHAERGVRWLRVNATPSALPEGGVLWHGSAFDMTEEVEQEQAFRATADTARETSSRLKRLTENVPGGIVEFAMNAEGDIEFPYFTTGWADLVGVPEETFRNNPAASFATVHPDDIEHLQQTIADSARTLKILKLSHRIIHPNRGLRWLRVNATPVAAPDDRVVWYGSVFDVTEETEREKALEIAVYTAKAATARLEKLTENVPGALFEYRLAADGTGMLLYATRNLGPLLGTTTEALLQNESHGFQHTHPDDRKMVAGAVDEARQSLSLFDIRYRLNHPECGLRWLQCKSTPIAQSDGAVVFYGSFLDVTDEVLRQQDLEAARNRMEALSLLDSLTGLPNRRAYDKEMAARCCDPKRRAQQQVIIRIDLDHFKSVNDTLGHAAGDAVLCRVARVLDEVLDVDDFCARLGGDEFVILPASGRSPDEADRIVARLRAKIREPFEFEGRPCRFDASFGIASADTLPEDPAELLAAADAALFEAKGRGRGQVAIYTKDLHDSLIRNRRRAGEIQQALDREEFVPFFQPQIDAATGEISGFEVLARWDRPGEGLVPPDEFIPVAEQMRVVKDIDQMMFSKAIKVLGTLQDRGFVVPKLGFNVSAARIHDADIIDSVRRLQTKGTRVAFELLESILLEEEGAVFEYHIDLLKELGIDIEVDDFGSGRASIIGVLRVAPRALKIDRRLVTPLFESGGAWGLVRAIVDMGRSLDIDIIAEGVETIDHAMALRDMGCQTLQGFAFARPMAANAVERYLSSFTPVLDCSAKTASN